MKLHEITGNYLALQEMDDLTPEALADTMESIEGEFEEKAKSIVAVSTNLSSDIEAIDNEIKRLQARKKAIQNNDKSLREYLKYNMQESGISNIKTAFFSITLAKGRDVVVIDNVDALPDEYTVVHTSIAPDKKALLAALKDGEDIPGAHIEKSEPSLRIT